MSGGKRNDEKGNKEEEDEGGWASTLFKVAGAAAATVAVASSLLSLLKQPTPDQVAVGAGGGGVQIREAQAMWTKPKVGWVKLNVDGSLLPQSAGCGGVLRDASGKWLRGFAQKLDHISRVDETEKEGIFRGLQWARDSGVRKLVAESDNEGVVFLVNNGRTSHDPLISDIRGLLHSPDWEVTLTWISREANQVAHKVADNAHALSSFVLREFDSPPFNCIAALSKEA